MSIEGYLKTFGKNTKIAREQKGLNQTELAKLLHTSQPNISNLEKGDNMSVDYYLKVAEVLKIPIEKILSSQELSRDFSNDEQLILTVDSFVNKETSNLKFKITKLQYDLIILNIVNQIKVDLKGVAEACSSENIDNVIKLVVNK